MKWICSSRISRDCNTRVIRGPMCGERLLASVLRVWRCTASRLRCVLMYCYLNNTTHWCPLSSKIKEAVRVCARPQPPRKR